MPLPADLWHYVAKDGPSALLPREASPRALQFELLPGPPDLSAIGCMVSLLFCIGSR